MPTLRWVGTTNDLATTTNWSPNGTPASNDTLRFVDANAINIAGIDWTAKTGLIIEVGPQFAGSVGTAGTKWQTGTGTVVRYNGQRCTGFFLSPAGGTVYVSDTSSYPSALTLYGTIGDVYCSRARSLNLMNGLTLTNLWLEGNQITAYLESGLVLTNAYVQGGAITCEAALTNLYQTGGIWDHCGSTTMNMTLAQIRGGTFNIRTTGGTYTAINVFGGRADASQSHGITVTNGQVHYGATLVLDNGENNIVATNAILVYGGTLIAGAGVSQTNYAASGTAGSSQM